MGTMKDAVTRPHTDGGARAWIRRCGGAALAGVLAVAGVLAGGLPGPWTAASAWAQAADGPAATPEEESRYSNFPLCTWRDGACESSFGPARRVRIPRELLFERQMLRHTVIHTNGRGPTQELGILLADYRQLTGRAASPSDRPVRISIATPPFPERTLDAGIVHIDHYEQADARILTRQQPISGEFELIIRRGRIVSHSWCWASGRWCQIRAVRGDVGLQISYDPRGSPGTEEMIAFAVDFVNRFIVDGPPIPREETE